MSTQTRGEDDVRAELDAFRVRSGDQRRRDDREHHLVDAERRVRDLSGERATDASPTSLKPRKSRPPIQPPSAITLPMSGPKASVWPMITQRTVTTPSAMKQCMIVLSTFLPDEPP